HLREENKRLKEQMGTPRMIGASTAFQRTLEQATLASRADVRVLLIGESGTGKELLAAHVHANSPFATGPFIKVNCAAIPNELMESELFGHEKGAFTGASALRRGKFELADGGTLFLDEVGDLPQAAQAKLLRVLQEGEFHRLGSEQAVKVSVRVISATNKDLSAEVANGRFREDLYYRLAVVPLRVPALRERPTDIRPLAEHFLDEFCGRNNVRAKSFDNETMDLLERYSWPGNARELRNVVERMAILGASDVLDKEAVPIEIRLGRDPEAPTSLEAARRTAERDHITKALEEANWNVSAAARALGMERTSLHKRIRALGVAR
ncbi:MAG: sigma-54-dependent Fis family transcriptional regulator, partial [Acidobacteria bacterium]|nr:sigma-54-dependent Fis family transcriptional regulator [Acidobacteriota bacterium]